MTCHFIETETLKRQSFVLGFQRILFSHSYDKIGAAICKIHSEFGLEISKITNTVTDNAANFCKAFRIYEENDDDDAEENYMERNEINIDHVSDIVLPPQFRCCVHILNLITTTDVNKMLSQSGTNNFKKYYRSSFAKLQSFWNISKRSTSASDIIEAECGCTFPVPIMTRWNSHFDAIIKILIYKSKFADLFEKLKIPKLNVFEWNLLEEYVKVMSSVAFTLDYFQGETNCYLGIVAPTINVLVLKLKQLSHLTMANDLKNCLITSIETRFKNLIDLDLPASKNFIISAGTHPKFKLSWVPKDFSAICQKILMEECVKESENTISDTSISECSEEDFFSNFLTSSSINNTENTIQMEVLSFLEHKSKDLCILEKYPIIKKIFLKYNTTIPSSAPVERLFSSAVQVFTPRRNRMSDELFEQLLFLKGNKDFD